MWWVSNVKQSYFTKGNKTDSVINEVKRPNHDINKCPISTE